MPDSGPITPRDLANLQNTISRLDRTLESFRQEIGNVYARKDVVDPALRDIKEDLEEVKGWITWAQRIVLAAVMLAMLGAVLVQNGGHP
jgi:hypothetical protein